MSSLDRLIRLARRTGDRLIIHDPKEETDVVIMDLDAYEFLLEMGDAHCCEHNDGEGEELEPEEISYEEPSYIAVETPAEQQNDSDVSVEAEHWGQVKAEMVKLEEMNQEIAALRDELAKREEQRKSDVLAEELAETEAEDELLSRLLADEDVAEASLPEPVPEAEMKKEALVTKVVTNKTDIVSPKADWFAAGQVLQDKYKKLTEGENSNWPKLENEQIRTESQRIPVKQAGDAVGEYDEDDEDPVFLEEPLV